MDNSPDEVAYDVVRRIFAAINEHQGFGKNPELFNEERLMLEAIVEEAISIDRKNVFIHLAQTFM